MGAAQGNYYLQLAREDYYHAGGEPSGQWWGRGAETLGLGSYVAPVALRALFRGFHPGGRALIQNAGAPDHQPGWDLTFSAPKGVSVLWSQAPEPLRERIQALHHAAVGAALYYLEEEGALTRRGRGGSRLERAGLAVATFEHGTSRALDPQLHTHALVLNVGTRLDGTTGTILSKPFYEHKMAAGALYRMELASLCHRELGLTLSSEEHGFAVDGIPHRVLEAFSTRRAEIEEHLHRHGTEGARAAEVAALQTRGEKEHVSRAALFGKWQTLGGELGFGPEMAQALCRRRGLSPSEEPAGQHREMQQEASRSLHEAAERLTERDSTFHRRDLLRELAERLPTGRWRAGELRDWLDHNLSSFPEVVPLGATRGEPCYSTREMLAVEQRLLDQALSSREDRSHQVEERAVGRVLERHRDLSSEQQAAVKQITQDAGSIQVVSGMAGTGKTRMLEAARAAWEDAGLTVYGAAVSAKASRGLQEGAGIQSHTLAKWGKDLGSGAGAALWHHGKQLLRAAQGKPTYAYAPLHLDARTVLVVDEAGMVGTRPLETLMGRAQAAGAKLVLVGDGRQLQPIEAGGPFQALQRLLGATELTQIQRQREEWARQAVHDFAEGRAGDALRAYAERGLLTVGETRQEAKAALVQDWTGEDKTPVSERLVVTTTNQDAQELNGRIQEARKAAGQLGTFWLEEGEQRYHRDDRVLFGKNDRLLGVENGTLGTVSGVNILDRALTVQLDSGERRTIPLNRYKELSLGYAVTTHKAQGATAEQVFLLAGGRLQDRELTYVQASRARAETRIYVERAEVGEPLAELARQMQTSHRKGLAQDYQPSPPIPARDGSRPRQTGQNHDLEREPDLDYGY